MRVFAVASDTACAFMMCVRFARRSMMLFVAALDRLPGMRCVLGLFEGVVTGAADEGYTPSNGQGEARVLADAAGQPVHLWRSGNTGLAA